MAIKFSDVSGHPYLQTKNIDKVLTYFPRVEKSQLLASVMPLINIAADQVEMDVDAALMGGMTPGVALGSESPMFAQGARGKIKWDSAEFREKVVLYEEELVNFRKLGTINEMEPARVVLANKYQALEKRMAQRIEDMRRQVLFEKQVVAPVGDVPAMTLATYQHADFLEPATATTWDQAGADPLNDLQLWIENYRILSEYAVGRIIFPAGTFRLLTQNTAFKAIAQGNYAAMSGSQAAIKSLMQNFLGVGNIEESAHTIDYASQASAEVAAAATTVTLRNVEGIVAGTELILKGPDMHMEKRTVASVSGKVVTVTAGFTSAFPLNSLAKWNTRTVPTNRILILGTPLMPQAQGDNSGYVDQDLLHNWADVASTNSRYEDFDNPRPGMFSKLIDKIASGDPPRIEQVLGIRALPRVHYQEGWMTPTIL